MILFAIRSNECILLFITENLQILPSTKSFITTINLPYTMIETNAISTSITKQSRILSGIFWIMHISITFKLKPINMILLWQTIYISNRRKDNNTLLQLIITKLYIVVNHTIIAYAPLIQICCTIVIWDIMPQCQLVWRLYLSDIQASKIRSRRRIILRDNTLYKHHHTASQ